MIIFVAPPKRVSKGIGNSRIEVYKTVCNRRAFISLVFIYIRTTTRFSFAMIYCPRRGFAQKAKSRGGTLVTRAYIKESTYGMPEKNLDLLEQGLRGIGR